MIINWNDAALESAMREITEITDRPIMAFDVAEITELNLEGYGIRNIEALRCFPRLQELNLESNVIQDIDPLSQLVELRKLSGTTGSAISDL